MTVFYRKYRPQKFADLVGQRPIVETLLAQLTSGKISHGYLFAGPRGSGKTSSARIFAKAVNCLLYKGEKFGEPCLKCQSCLAIADGSHLDLIEIDAASNRGIDEIRDLREKVKTSPVSSRFKVYIIDEAHMLTTEAFNALLKTLEEPPKHAIFILCTTASAKLPATIISRLARFNFARATDDEIIAAISKIAKAEKTDVEGEALLSIAKLADGSFRDAVSLFDQLASKGKKIKASDVSVISGRSGWNLISDFVAKIEGDDLAGAVEMVEELPREDLDISNFIKEVIGVFEATLMVKLGIEDLQRINFDDVQIAEVTKFASGFSFEKLQHAMKVLLLAESEIKIYPLPKIPLILALFKVCKEPGSPRFALEAGESVSQRVSDSARLASVVKRVDQNTETPTHRPTGKIETLKVSDSPRKNSMSMSKIETLKVSDSSKKNSISMSKVETNWGQFLEKVKKVNVHLVALLRSTRPVEVSGDILTIEVFYSFHKDKLEEPKIYKMLEGFMEEIFNTKVGLKFIIASRQNKVPVTVVKSDVVDVSSADLSQLAAEIFSK